VRRISHATPPSWTPDTVDTGYRGVSSGFRRALLASPRSFFSSLFSSLFSKLCAEQRRYQPLLCSVPTASSMRRRGATSPCSALCPQPAPCGAESAEALPVSASALCSVLSFPHFSQVCAAQREALPASPLLYAHIQLYAARAETLPVSASALLLCAQCCQSIASSNVAQRRSWPLLLLCAR
jgi:hypothetical protein